jgi:hypothetical protein
MRWLMVLLVTMVACLWCYADARREAAEPLGRSFSEPTLRPRFDPGSFEGEEWYPVDEAAVVCDRPDRAVPRSSIRSTLPLDPPPAPVYCSRTALAGGSPCC